MRDADHLGNDRTFRELAYAGETPEPHTPLIPGAMYGADGISPAAPTGLDKAAPFKRSDAMPGDAGG